MTETTLHSREALAETISRVERAAARHRDLAELLDALLVEVAAALDVEGAAIYLHEEERGALRLVRHHGLPRAFVEQTALLSYDAPSLIVRAASGLAVEGAMVALPLRLEGERIGVLVTARAQARPLSPDEREALLTLGAIAAVAIAGAKAREAERRLQAQIEALRAANLAVLDKLSILPESHLRDALEREFRIWPTLQEEGLPEFLDDVIRTIVEHARSATGAEMAAFGVGETPTQPFAPWVFTGISPEQAASIGRTPRPVGVLGFVACGGQVVRVADIHEHPAFLGLPPYHPEVKSLLGIPVRYRGASLGTLYLGNKVDADTFTPEDQQISELLASQAAIALQQAYLRAAIDAQRAQLQIILGSAPHGILFVEAKTGYVMANPRARALLGSPLVPEAGRAQYLGRLCRVDGLPLEQDELPSSLALEGQEIQARELLIIQPEGRRIPVLLSAAPVRDLEGQVMGAVVLFEDISPLKEIEKLREDFAAVVAHDLRGPVQAILLQAARLQRHLAQDGRSAPLNIVHQIEQSATRLGEMIRDLLDATRIDLGRVPLEREPLALPEAASQLIERIRPVLDPHPVSVRADARAPLAWVDPLRFEQILTNLLDNAAKYSAASAPIEVHVSPQEGGVLLSVEDQGSGIAPEELPRLFERFYQNRRAREKKTGLGLGLHITKGLVEAHGGRIWVESELGLGSTFHVWFPSWSAASPPSQEAGPPL